MMRGREGDFLHFHLQNVNSVNKRRIMTNQNNRQILSKSLSSKKDSLVDSVRILSDITRRDIEKSYNINDTYSTEAYYSNRYGWTLRRSID